MAERWRTLREEPVAHDKFLEVRRGDFELPNGEELEGYLTMTESDAVHIVPVTPDGETLLIRQYRYGVDGCTYESPAGFLEQGEHDPLERAKHELREETGYEAERWVALGVMHPTINRMHKTEHCFLALGARQVGDQELDTTESAEWERVPLAGVRQMIARGEITSTSTLAVLCKALTALEEIGKDAD